MIYSVKAFNDAVELLRAQAPNCMMDKVEDMLREALAASGAALEAME